jgi:hypothetical protein
MSSDGQFKQDVRSVALNLIANLIWFLLAVSSAAAMVFVFRSAKGEGLAAKISVPAWLIFVLAVIGIGTAAFIYVTSKRASAVRGRLQATSTNVALLASRRRVDSSGRVIRSTRFGRWPPNEDLANRTDFRKELERAIVDEGADVRRIWNVSSIDDSARLRTLLERYEGRSNHSIRAYFGVLDHLMPELLIVEKRGASISFASTRTPHSLDWAISVKRKDIVYVVRDYFDVLWDRAEKILDSGEITESGRAAIERFEASLTTNTYRKE